MSTAKSLLSVIKAADNFPSSPYTDLYPSSHPTNGERYVSLHLSFQDYQRGLTPIGLLRPHVIEEIQTASSKNSAAKLATASVTKLTENQGDEASEAASPWQFHLIETAQKPSTVPSDDMDTDEDVEVTIGCVFLADWVVRGGPEGITTVLGDVVEKWKKEGRFPGPLGGWRNEKYSIYGPSGSSIFTSSAESSSKTFANVAFALERSACAIFGLATFGVHMTAYEGEGSDMKIWVPKRSATKATWPSRLDNSVAGGIPHGMTPAESMVKECDEEASLPEQLVRKRMRNTGVSTYFYITDDGYLQPEIEYIYDLQLPPRDSAEYVLPRPHDDEVESFALLSVPEVIEALHSGDFKPNCGLILVDFLMRHGLITPENEPNYIEIAWRMRRRLNIAVPS